MEKILVAYASRAGSTAEVAQAVGQALQARGSAVDVLPLEDVRDLSTYRAAVLGSAVRFGQVVPEMAKFVEANQISLRQMPVAAFAVHLLNSADDETSRKNRDQYLAPIRKFIQPKAEAWFTGVGDLAKISFIERAISKMVKSPVGDFRDWKAIRAWADGLREALL